MGLLNPVEVSQKTEESVIKCKNSVTKYSNCSNLDHSKRGEFYKI
jgi:hypothetical protein